MKLSKVFSVVAIAIILVTSFANVAFAKTTNPLDPGTITGTTNGTTSIQTVGKNVVGIVQTVGSIVAVVVLVVLGIKYMMGSAEEKAEYKKTLIPYVVGAVLIFAASNVAGIVYDWAITIK